MPHVRMHKNESPADVTRWLADRSAGRWPALLGSLSLRRSPCIRKNCQACRSGEQHPSYVLYGRPAQPAALAAQLSKLFAWARERKHVGVNPALDLYKPRQGKGRDRVLNVKLDVRKADEEAG